jgi:Protein of unknown function (DUF3047)
MTEAFHQTVISRSRLPLAGILAFLAMGSAAPALARGFPVDVHRFAVLERDSGPTNYYHTVEIPSGDFIRGRYEPPLRTVTLFADVGDALRNGVERIRFRWRAWVLPIHGNECVAGRADGAANVYVVWKRGLRWYSLKLVWSSEAPVGVTCNGTRNPFVASDSIIVRSGAPTGEWREEEIDPAALFRAHFEGGNPEAEVPELQGIGIMTDGDQTGTTSMADYGGFVLYKQERVASR